MFVAFMMLLAADGLAAPPPSAVATHATGPDLALSIRDYPREARVRRETGRATIRFVIDAAGKAGGCEIVQSSGSAVLDARSCEIAIEARWRPARDAQGNPVSEAWRWAINWRISSRPQIDFETPEPESVATRRSVTAAVPPIAVGKANWATMPPIKLRQGTFDPERVNEEVRQIIAGNRCAILGARPNRYDLYVNYALLLSPEGRAEQALVEDIGCRPVETIVGSIITARTRLEHIEAPAGTTKQWHRGRVHFTAY